jgi:hypothetical protein
MSNPVAPALLRACATYDGAMYRSKLYRESLRWWATAIVIVCVGAMGACAMYL